MIPSRCVFRRLLFGTVLGLSGWFLLWGVVPGSVRADSDFVQRVRDAPTHMINLPQNERTRVLLRQFQPRLYVARESYLPISFYRDYLPHCLLRNGDGEVVERAPDQSRLRTVSDSDGYYLDFQPSPDEVLQNTIHEVRSTLYGRVYADTFTHDGRSVPLLFLKYNPVFPYSGLAVGKAWWKRWGSHLIGSPRAWHELDIHGAIHVVLTRQKKRPVALILAQHNHHRVYWVGDDFSWPKGNRVRISFAKFSNEPYPIMGTPERRWERSVGHPLQLPYLFGRSDRAPLSGGRDLVLTPETGAREVPARLVQLPPDDPLYTARIPLGDKQGFLGLTQSWYRTGPPGMDYYTMPALKNMADLLAFWNIDPDDDAFFRMFERRSTELEHFQMGPLLEHQKQKTMKDLRRVIKHPPGPYTNRGPGRFQPPLIHER